ncbi:MAG: hypothetical protein IPQ06_02595 [Chitinophagaceae bacterium]|nr:hypothetical protein [Chitinophagaceae bacterium]MBK9570332.1 hypothetical protein [Chitinophagaceae bacterium]MBL0271976.1 hypothetical protein [Chitinophagaceae bacterium]
MKRILSERNIVVVLFVMVLISFSLAQEDTRKMERMYMGINAGAGSHRFLVHQPGIKMQNSNTNDFLPVASAE